MIMYGRELCPPSEWNNYYLIVDQSAIDDNNLIQVLQRRLCKVCRYSMNGDRQGKLFKLARELMTFETSFQNCFPVDTPTKSYLHR